MKRRMLASAIAVASTAMSGVCAAQVQVQGQQQDRQAAVGAIEELLVVSQQVTYGNSSVSEAMIAQTSPIASVLDVVGHLPGVLVNEGDAFGGDDWSTTISMRGFQVNLDEQQLGMTVDGIPNGNSNYGGGAKANRFIDTFNLQGVDVSQGTSDIATRSHEALGGTLNFLTDDPVAEERLRTAFAFGDYNAQKFYGRYDTGLMINNTSAWVSVSSSSVDSWIDQSGESSRDHIAAKAKTLLGGIGLTGYIAYDDTHEDNYQRLFSLEEFQQNSDWDRLTGDWTGIPHIDQLYRRGWSTLRENLLGYVKAEFNVGPVNFETNVYMHDNEGRGDWIPPYVANISDEGEGSAHAELESGNTVYGGSMDAAITFVNASGIAVAPIDGCESSITFPYGGASAAYDPACHPAGALPVSSYRHTHYKKQRYGFNADFDWTADLGAFSNTLRGGFWYEDYNREESRDWHKVIDSRTSYHYDHTPYWVQYDREYPVETVMYYIDDSVTVGPLTARLGAKQFLVDVERQDRLADNNEGSASVNSDSDVLLSGGLIFALPIEGAEIFYGYAENFAAIKDPVLETAGTSIGNLEPETAQNQDLGLRYQANRFTGSLTYYRIDFDNRIVYTPEGAVDGIDYSGELDGSYTNVGGIESEGFEAAMQLDLIDSVSFYASYTYNDATYLGTGDAELNEELGIHVGNTVAGSPEQMYVTSLNWYRGPYEAGLSWKHVGERWLDEANESEVHAYDTVDFRVSVNLEDVAPNIHGARVDFNINNLLDEDYLGGISGGGAWIAPGRTATATLRLDF